MKLLSVKNKRGDVGIAPYTMFSGKLFVGADAHISPYVIMEYKIQIQ